MQEQQRVIEVDSVSVGMGRMAGQEWHRIKRQFK